MYFTIQNRTQMCFSIINCIWLDTLKFKTNLSFLSNLTSCVILFSDPQIFDETPKKRSHYFPTTEVLRESVETPVEVSCALLEPFV